jgi:hypothetical protein
MDLDLDLNERDGDPQPGPFITCTFSSISCLLSSPPASFAFAQLFLLAVLPHLLIFQLSCLFAGLFCQLSYPLFPFPSVLFLIFPPCPFPLCPFPSSSFSLFYSCSNPSFLSLFFLSLSVLSFAILSLLPLSLLPFHFPPATPSIPHGPNPLSSLLLPLFSFPFPSFLSPLSPWSGGSVDQLVADSHHFIRIKVISRIGIRIKVMRMRNPLLNYNSFDCCAELSRALPELEADAPAAELPGRQQQDPHVR